MGCNNSKNVLKLEKGTFTGFYRLVSIDKILIEGTYKFKNGSTYIGEFSNNKFNGKGKLITNNFIMKGTWKDNMLDGKCTIQGDNCLYEGDFKYGKPNGTFKIINNKYEYYGGMKNGKLSGIGSIKYNNELIYEGKWNYNKPYLYGKYYEDNKVYNVKIINDKIILDNGEEILMDIIIGTFRILNFPQNYCIP